LCVHRVGEFIHDEQVSAARPRFHPNWAMTALAKPTPS
jgi:hypothetical protein